MKKVIYVFGRLLSVSLMIAGVVFFAGCATSSAPENKVALGEPAIVSVPGFYENKTLGVSLTYLPNLFSVENDLEPGVLLSREGAQKIPSLVLRVADIPAGVTLDQVGESIKNDFSQQFPDSNGFEIVESKMVKLSTGVDANSILMKWRYQGSVPLYTACVSSYKNNQIIGVYTTSVQGQPAPDVLMQMAMALKVKP
jgi:hypothetical protein